MKGVGAMKAHAASGVGKMKPSAHGVGKMRGSEAEGDKKKSAAAAEDLAKLFEKKK
jgi:hypothetical protein